MKVSFKSFEDNVFSAVYTRLIDGSEEKIYFGMELIDKNNVKNWSDYKYDMGHFITPMRGLISVLAFLCKKQETKYDSSIAEVTGMTEEEFTEYIELLRNRGMDKEGKVKTLEAIYSGVAGFSASEGSYVSYVSKIPVTTRFLFPERKPSSNLTLKEFNYTYSNIIMSVGTTLISDQVYNNRGIFRNPANLVTGVYPNVSVVLHAFTALVCKEKFNKKYMSVGALPAMTKILLENLEDEDYYKQDDVPEQYYNTFVGFGALDTRLLIKIDSLVAQLR